MDTSTVPQKGQIVIPAALRRKLGVEPDTKVVTAEPGGSARGRPAPRSYSEQFVGMLFEGEAPATEVLLEQRAHDHERENIERASGTDDTDTWLAHRCPETMSLIVLDSYALLAHFRGELGQEQVTDRRPG